MKKSLHLTIMLSMISSCLDAQPMLWSMTEFNATSGNGSIFKMDLNGGGYATPFIFIGQQGGNPVASLLESSNGKLYGMTPRLGSHNSGVLFSYDRFTNTYDTLHNFTAVVFQGPSGSLIEASNGKLYGLVPTGGMYNMGVLFSYDTLTAAYDTLHNFNYPAGVIPFGSLIQATDGKLYGMTYGDGIAGQGTIFCFDPVSNLYGTVGSFNAFNGQGPYGSLIQATNGKLYGMTRTGGNTNTGCVFSFNTADSMITNLHNFMTSDGSTPYGDLTELNGYLYGLTSEGGANGAGVIFKIDTLGNNFTVLESFNNTVTGSAPFGSLFKASNNVLYGMTSLGGTYGGGVIFSFTTQLNVLRNLNVTTDGNYPYYSKFIEINDNTSAIDILTAKKSAVTVSPSPAHASVNIHVPGELICKTGQLLIITDGCGKKICQQLISQNDIIIDVSMWNAGMYFYNLSGGIESRSGKFIVEK